MKIYIHTLGCKVNQYETQAMETLLTERGHEIILTETGCDAFIVNTCAVTAESGRKSRQAIRHLKECNPGAISCVCGCYSQISPEDIASLGVDLVAGSADRVKFLDLLEKVTAEKIKLRSIDEALKRRAFENLPAGKMPGRTRAMLKIEDGCSNFCTYCIIPYARGPVRSMLPEDVLAEAARLDEEGFREIIVTGIEIASYGKDLKSGITLSDSIPAICKAAPHARIRLGSLEARVITEDFCKKLWEAGNVCDHFHLSLQSGCDATLKRMHRKYDTAQFYEGVTLLRRYFPDCALTADLITGFPGETEEEFSETLAFIRKVGFSQMHIFPYSRREGTPADKMPEQIERRIKAERASCASAVAEEMKTDYLRRQIGKTLRVLFEHEKDGVFYGHSANYCEVAAYGENLNNCMLNVQITEEKAGILWGKILL